MWTPKITREKIVQNALDLIGMPVCYPRRIGTPDCLDIVAEIYEYEDIEQSRSTFLDESVLFLHSAIKSILGWYTRKQEDPIAGDLLLIEINMGKNSVYHVGVYIGNDVFVHAGRVNVVKSNYTRWKKYVKEVLTW